MQIFNLIIQKYHEKAINIFVDTFIRYCWFQLFNLLDTTTYGQQTSETFYKTDTQIGEALTGAYLQLRVKWNEYALDHYLIGDCTTDDALKGGGSEEIWLKCMIWNSLLLSLVMPAGC